MLKYVLVSFINDIVVIVPTAIIITVIGVAIVEKFDIEPIKTWLHTED